MSRAASAGFWARKRRIAGVENVAFYPLDIPYVSLTNNKISKYSKRSSAQFDYDGQNEYEACLKSKFHPYHR